MQSTKLNKKLINFFTPLKMVSVLLVLLAILNHLYNPFEHYADSSTFGEIIARIIFLFCGIFGLIGNGKTAKLRAIIASFPLLYLGTVYGLKFLDTGIRTVVLPLTMFLSIGIWTLFVGDKYERRA